MTKTKQAPIRQFADEFRFLSNFFPCNVNFAGINFPSVEHAFQAAKTKELGERVAISKLKTPALAKAAGRRLRLDLTAWNKSREQIMYGLLFNKFLQNMDLRAKLIETAPLLLEEGNHWHDNYWGICHCGKRADCDPAKALNRLGILLMKLRESLILGTAFR